MNKEEIKKNLWRIIVYVKPFIPFDKIMRALGADRHDIAWIRRLYEKSLPPIRGGGSRVYSEYIVETAFETFSNNEMSDKFVEGMKLNPLEVGSFVGEINSLFLLPKGSYPELDNSIMFVQKATIA